MGKSTRLGLGVLLLVMGIGAMIYGGFIFPAQMQTDLDTNITDAVVLDPTKSIRIDNWKQRSSFGSGTDKMSSYRYFFFNVTNLDAVLRGAKPALKEIGPYVYNIHSSKYDIRFGVNGPNTVAYRTYEYLVFDESRSRSVSGRFFYESDLIATVNVPYVQTLVELAKNNQTENFLQAQFANEMLYNFNKTIRGEALAQVKLRRMQQYLPELYRRLRYRAIKPVVANVYSEVRTAYLPKVLSKTFANIRFGYLTEALSEVYESLTFLSIPVNLAKIYMDARKVALYDVLGKLYDRMKSDGIPHMLATTAEEMKVDMVPVELAAVYKQARLLSLPSLLKNVFYEASLWRIPALISAIYEAMVTTGSTLCSNNGGDAAGCFTIHTLQTLDKWRSGTTATNIDSYVPENDPAGVPRFGFELSLTKSSTDPGRPTQSISNVLFGKGPYSFLSEAGFVIWHKVMNGDAVARQQLIDNLAPITNEMIDAINAWLKTWINGLVTIRDRQTQWRKGTSNIDIDRATSAVDKGFEMDPGASGWRTGKSAQTAVSAGAARYFWDETKSHAFTNYSAFHLHWVPAMNGDVSVQTAIKDACNADPVLSEFGSKGVTLAQVEAIAEWLRMYIDAPSTAVFRGADYLKSFVQTQWRSGSCKPSNSSTIFNATGNFSYVSTTTHPCNLLDLYYDIEGVQKGFELNPLGKEGVAPSAKAAKYLWDSTSAYSFLNPIYNYGGQSHTGGFGSWKDARSYDAVKNSALLTINLVLSSPVYGASATELLTEIQFDFISKWLFTWPSHSSFNRKIAHRWQQDTCKDNKETVTFSASLQAHQLTCTDSEVLVYQTPTSGVDTHKVRSQPYSPLKFESNVSPLRTTNITSIKTVVSCTPYNGTLFYSQTQHEVQNVSLTGVISGTFKLSFPLLNATSGQTIFLNTTSISFDASAGSVKSALDDLSSIVTVNVAKDTSSVENTTTFMVTFIGELSGNNTGALLIINETLVSSSATAMQVTSVHHGAILALNKSFIFHNKTTTIYSNQSLSFSCDNYAWSSYSRLAGIRVPLGFNTQGIAESRVSFDVAQKMFEPLEKGKAMVEYNGFTSLKLAGSSNVTSGAIAAAKYVSQFGPGIDANQTIAIGKWLTTMEYDNYMNVFLQDNWLNGVKPMDLKPFDKESILSGMEVFSVLNTSARVACTKKPCPDADIWKFTVPYLHKASNKYSFFNATGIQNWLNIGVKTGTNADKLTRLEIKLEIATALLNAGAGGQNWVTLTSQHIAAAKSVVDAGKTSILAESDKQCANYDICKAITTISSFISAWTNNPVLIEEVIKQWRDGSSVMDLDINTPGVQGGFELDLTGSTNLNSAIGAALWDNKNEFSFMNNPAINPAEVGYKKWAKSRTDTNAANEIIKKVEKYVNPSCADPSTVNEWTLKLNVSTASKSSASITEGNFSISLTGSETKSYTLPFNTSANGTNSLAHVVQSQLSSWYPSGEVLTSGAQRHAGAKGSFIWELEFQLYSHAAVSLSVSTFASSLDVSSTLVISNATRIIVPACQATLKRLSMSEFTKIRNWLFAWSTNPLLVKQIQRGWSCAGYSGTPCSPVDLDNEQSGLQQGFEVDLTNSLGIAPHHTSYLFDKTNAFSFLNDGMLFDNNTKSATGIHAWHQVLDGLDPSTEILTGDGFVELQQHSSNSSLVEQISVATNIEPPCKPPTLFHHINVTLETVAPQNATSNHTFTGNFELSFGNIMNTSSVTIGNIAHNITIADLKKKVLDLNSKFPSSFQLSGVSHARREGPVNYGGYKWIFTLDSLQKFDQTTSSVSGNQIKVHSKNSFSASSVSASVGLSGRNWNHSVSHYCPPRNGLNAEQVRSIASWVFQWTNNTVMREKVETYWRTGCSSASCKFDLDRYISSGYPFQSPQTGFEISQTGLAISQAQARFLWDPTLTCSDPKTCVSFLHPDGIRNWEKAFTGNNTRTGVSPATRLPQKGSGDAVEAIFLNTNSLPDCLTNFTTMDTQTHQNTTVNQTLNSSVTSVTSKNGSAVLTTTTISYFDTSTGVLVKTEIERKNVYSCPKRNGLTPDQIQIIADWLFSWVDNPVLLSSLHNDWRNIDSALPYWLFPFKNVAPALQAPSNGIGGMGLKLTFPGENYMQNKQARSLVQSNTTSINAAAAAYLWDPKNPGSFLNEAGHDKWIRATLLGDLTAKESLIAAIPDTYLKGNRTSGTQPTSSVGSPSIFRKDPANFESIARWFTSWAVHPVLQSVLQQIWISGDIPTAWQEGTCYDLKRDSRFPEGTFSAVSFNAVGCQNGFEFNATSLVPAHHQVSASAAKRLWDPTIETSLLNPDGFAIWRASLRGCESSTPTGKCLLVPAPVNATNLASKQVLASGIGASNDVIENIANGWLINLLDNDVFVGDFVDEYAHAQAKHITDLAYLQFGQGLYTKQVDKVDSLWHLQTKRKFSPESGKVIITPETKLHGFPELSEFCKHGSLNNTKSFHGFQKCVSFLHLQQSKDVLDIMADRIPIAKGPLGMTRGMLASLQFMKQPFPRSTSGRILCEESADLIAKAFGSAKFSPSTCEISPNGYFMSGFNLTENAHVDVREYLRYVATKFVFEPEILQISPIPGFDQTGLSRGGYFTTQAAGDLIMHGYSDPLHTKWKALGLHPQQDKFGRTDTETFSFYQNLTHAQRNRTTGDYVVRVGVNTPYDKELSHVGTLERWEGKDKISVWGENVVVKGTDGSQFEPNLGGTNPDGTEYPLVHEFNYWWPAGQRPLKIKFIKDVTRFGIKLRRFKMDSLTRYQEGADKTTPLNLIDVRSAHGGSPVYLGYPHFLYGVISVVREGVTGLVPRDTAHETIFDVEPRSGLVMNKRIRYQMNVKIGQTSTWYRDISEPYLPVFWIEEMSSIAMNEAETWKDYVHFALALQRKIPIVSFFVGSLFLFGSFVLLLLGLRSNDKVTFIEDNDGAIPAPKLPKTVPRSSFSMPGPPPNPPNGFSGVAPGGL
jgi:hypothetical protein